MHRLIVFLFLFVLIADLSAQRQRRSRVPDHIVRPQIADTVKLNVYADNWFQLYINGKLIATDSIEFMPHNVVSVDILPEYPMTIAVMARDNADAITGKEYEHSVIGDGGFILKLGDDLVSNASWKAKCYFFGPMEDQDPVVKHIPIPEDWMAVDFDDLNWESATVYEAATVRPPRVFSEYDFEGAEFIWTSDLELHNTIVFRTTIDKPGWKPRWNTGTPARRIEDLEKGE